nr:radical SAM protein [Desulfobacula sp.]
MIRLEKIYLEIHNRCNLSCPFCLAPRRPPQTMAGDQILRILPRIKNIASTVCLHVLGEPLFHPEFDAVCDLFTAWGIPLQITTNGTLLHKKQGVILKQNSIRQINISVHALDSLPDCHEFLAQIRDFCSRAQILRPDLYINLRFWNYQNLGKSPAFQFFKSLFRFDDSRIDIRWKKSFLLQGRLYLNFDAQFQWPCPAHPVRSLKGYCHGLSTHCGILTNGDVVPCCLDGNGEMVLGNCLVTPLEEILSSPRAQNMVAHFKKGELIESLCRRCDFISRFDKKAQGAGRSKPVS